MMKKMNNIVFVAPTSAQATRFFEEIAKDFLSEEIHCSSRVIKFRDGRVLYVLPESNLSTFLMGRHNIEVRSVFDYGEEDIL